MQRSKSILSEGWKLARIQTPRYFIYTSVSAGIEVVASVRTNKGEGHDHTISSKATVLSCEQTFSHDTLLISERV